MFFAYTFKLNIFVLQTEGYAYINYMWKIMNETKDWNLHLLMTFFFLWILCNVPSGTKEVVCKTFVVLSYAYEIKIDWCCGLQYSCLGLPYLILPAHWKKNEIEDFASDHETLKLYSHIL